MRRRTIDVICGVQVRMGAVLRSRWNPEFLKVGSEAAGTCSMTTATSSMAHTRANRRRCTPRRVSWFRNAARLAPVTLCPANLIVAVQGSGDIIGCRKAIRRVDSKNI